MCSPAASRRLGHTDTGEPITGRDLIALLATIGIDLGLLALAIVNPPREGPSMRPSGALRRQINEAIDTAIARAGVDREWVHRHFIHHNKASYLVIPNLYAADPKNEEGIHEGAGLEPARRRAERSGAGALAEARHSMGLVAPEEERARASQEGGDLQERHRPDRVRKKWFEEKGLDPAKAARQHSDRPIRNHGLFSKAERALEIAGWSEAPATTSRSSAWSTPRA